MIDEKLSTKLKNYCKKDNLERIKELLPSDGKCDFLDFDMAIEVASRYGSIKVVSFLIESHEASRYNINQKMIFRALLNSIEHDKIDIFNKLFEYESVVNQIRTNQKDMDSLFSSALLHCKIEVVDSFIRHFKIKASQKAIDFLKVNTLYQNFIKELETRQNFYILNEKVNLKNLSVEQSQKNKI